MAQTSDTQPEDSPSVLQQVQSQMPRGTVDPSVPFGSIAVLNQDTLLNQSLYGQRIQRDLEVASQALSLENRGIEAELTDEELRLTELRPSMEPTEFRALAAEFDTRVEAIRAAQIAKERSLQLQVEAAQTQFFELAFPVLLDLVQSRGASVLMDSRSVLLAAEGIDITAEAIARVDDAIGAGDDDEPLISIDVPAPDTAPAPRPSAP